jgi:porin
LVRRLLLASFAAILGFRVGQCRALGNNDSTGWIWSEGRAGRLAAGIDLSPWGASFAGLNISELFADIHGGTDRATVGDDLSYLEGNFELGPVAGWSHALVHASALLVRGRGLSEAALDSNLLTVSNIETKTDTQLHELWLEQLLLHRTVSLRVGQLAADAEFAISPVSETFLNGSHGWPAILAANLPGGGPAYPLASPAARVAWLPSARFAFAAGVYSNAGSPHGTVFPFGTGALVMAESRYSFVSSLLPGSLSLGYWHDSGSQDSSVPAAQARLSESRQSGYYFMVDRAWEQPSHVTLSTYARGFIADSRDRAVSRFFDTGIELARIYSDQRQDMLGVALALAVPGTELDPASPRDQRRQLDLELTYSLRLYDAWTLQPDMQYLVHPGTRIDAIGRPSRIANALVAGLRVSYEF